jgi:SAM-dependent methyltransferase
VPGCAARCSGAATCAGGCRGRRGCGPGRGRLDERRGCRPDSAGIVEPVRARKGAPIGIDARYTDGEYLSANPDWHVADSPWKAAQVLDALDGWQPESICEVGCGVGAILRELHDRFPTTRLVGYEIAAAPLELAKARATDRLEFRLQDATADDERFDLMLIMDVIEHVPDPIGFLAALRDKASLAILHIPLDLSAQSVLRSQKLLDWRRSLGHIHYFTPETAIATVRDAGYDVTATRFLPGFKGPQETVKARIAKLPRTLLPTGVTVRLLGGYSLLVTAAPTSTAA